jgi:transcriptional regulator with XRE-family HTH domain
MDTGVGTTLREARNRRKISLAEVEEATRIRSRYLQAIENEEWDVLPGGIYTRSFVRTYASFLGLDGERLAEEYRQKAELAPDPERESHPEPAAVPARQKRRRGPSGPAWTAIVSVALIVALVVIGLTSGGENTATPLSSHRQRGAFHSRAVVPVAQRPRGVSISLLASAEVWVCLLNASGRPLVDGQILTAGTQAGPFHSGSFTVSLGNGDLSMKINGQAARIPVSSSPVGYSIDSKGGLKQLSESERPTCG